jgi:protoheme IX farnesyltransferase
LSDYWALTKPEINFLIALTTAGAFVMASPSGPPHLPWTLLFHTVLGTVLVASAAAALNQLIEMRFDRQMRRTARRPLASGRLEPSHVLWFGTSLCLLGIVDLVLYTNILVVLLAVFTFLSYLFLYTPLKRVTPLCTCIGAIPGAAPVLMGWAAARSRFDLGAWVLYAVLFFWQFPHFMAIAWMYREDYARAGYRVLPLGQLRNRFVTWQTVGAALALIPLGLIPTLTGSATPICSAAVFILGAIFLYYSVCFALRSSTGSARQLLVASIIYLPVLFALLILSRA